ncbi:hypothetical protein TDB9533_03813 [Thalassocella blandensis]|nr:hypothetical protein TDB9533_03813 [Thalassocella blandensis]
MRKLTVLFIYFVCGFLGQSNSGKALLEKTLVEKSHLKKTYLKKTLAVKAKLGNLPVRRQTARN